MAGSAPFIGRQEELAELQRLLARTREGAGAIALVGGELGIGKTRLVEEFLSTAGPALVGQGRWSEAGPDPAYIGFREALSSLCLYPDVRQRLSLLDGYRQELARLGPELAEALDTAGPEPIAESVDDQYRLWRAVAFLLQAAGPVCPAILSLDDVQWADQSSLGLLGLLGREVRDLPVLIVATYREEDVPAGHPLHGTLADLARADALRAIQLDGLSRGEIAQLAGDVSDRTVADDVIDTLHRETRGNPLFVTELLHQILAHPSPDRDQVTAVELMVPDGLRRVIARRLGAMSEAGTHMLRLASVLGGDFDLSVLETMSEMSRAAAMRAIEEAVAAHAIDDGARGRFAFHHPLVRSVVLEQLSPPERLSDHLKAALAMEKHYGGNALRHAREIAQHLIAAGSLADPEQTVRYCLAGARQARASFAFDEDGQLLHAALDAVERTREDDPRVRAQILNELGYAETALGRPDEAQRRYRQALAIHRSLNDLDAVTDTRRWLATTLARYGRWAEALEVTSEALVEAPEANSYPYVGLLGSHSMALIISARFSEAEPWVYKLLKLAFDDSTRAVAHHVAACWHSWGGGDPAQAVPYFKRATTLFMRAGADGTEAGAALDLAVVAYFLGQARQARAAMKQAERLATSTGRIATLADIHAFKSVLCVQRGDLAQAERERAAWRARLKDVSGRTVYGQLGELAEALQALWQHGPDRAEGLLSAEFPLSTGPFRARLAVERGDTDAARRLLDALQAAIPPDGRGLVWLAMVLPLVSALSSLGDARVVKWVDALSRYRGGGFAWSLVDLELARAHTVTGDWDVAERLFEEAAASTKERGLRPFYAIALREHALMLDRRRRAGDRNASVGLLDEAADVFDSLGLERMRDDTACLLEMRGRGRPFSHAPCGLTPRETAVLKLLVRGCSTKEIAGQLVVREKTVSRHLEGIYEKLGVSNRVAAIAKAMQDRIVEP